MCLSNTMAQVFTGFQWGQCFCAVSGWRFEISDCKSMERKYMINSTILYTPEPSKNIIIFIIPFDICTIIQVVHSTPFLRECRATVNSTFKPRQPSVAESLVVIDFGILKRTESTSATHCFLCIFEHVGRSFLTSIDRHVLSKTTGMFAERA